MRSNKTWLHRIAMFDPQSLSSLDALSRGTHPRAAAVVVVSLGECFVEQLFVCIQMHLLRQPEGNLIVVEGYIPGAGNCFMGRCLLRRLVAFIVLLLTRDTFFLTLTGTNGTSFVFSTTVLSGQ